MTLEESTKLIPLGTEVKVGNKLGFIQSAELVQAHPCGLISKHEIKLTHKIEFWKTANHNKDVILKHKITKIKPRVITSRFTFIKITNYLKQ